MGLRSLDSFYVATFSILPQGPKWLFKLPLSHLYSSQEEGLKNGMSPPFKTTTPKSHASISILLEECCHMIINRFYSHCPPAHLKCWDLLLRKKGRTDIGGQFIVSATVGLLYWLHTEAAHMGCVMESPGLSALALGLGIGGLLMSVFHA